MKNRPALVWLATLITFVAGYALGKYGYAIDNLLNGCYFGNCPCYPC